MPEPPEPEIAGAAEETRVDAVTPPAPKPGATDPKPKTRRRASTRRAAAKKPGKPKAAKATTSPAAAGPSLSATQLRTQRANAAAELLVLPAIPATFAGHTVLVEHFKAVGPITANRLAELAEQSPEIARVMDKASEGNVFLGLIMVALGYAGPVLLCFAGRSEQAAGASMAVQMMDAAPGTLAAMMSAVNEAGEGEDDDDPAVPPFGPPATGQPPQV